MGRDTDSYSAIATAFGVSKSRVSRTSLNVVHEYPWRGWGLSVGKKGTEHVRKQIRSLISANEHISSKGISADLATGSSLRVVSSCT